MSSDRFEKIVSLCKRRGFIVQSSEIYGGLPATYDYGPLGVELKRNVVARWWRSMTYKHQEIEGFDAAILMHPDVWKASGHVDEFADPMIDDKVSKKRFRADQLIEEAIQRRRNKGDDDGAEQLHQRLTDALNGTDLLRSLYQLIIDEKIASPESGSMDWTEVRQFNMMLKTRIGATDRHSSEIYLRPETAQGIFVNFGHVREVSRQQIPFGIAQVGKAFRNEIVARQFVFRMREFEQMEMQYFIRPGTQDEVFKRWKEERMAWHERNGISGNKLRFKEHQKLAHYADAAVDIEYEYPIGWREIEGIHSRTDHDLRGHAEHSGKKQTYYDPNQDKNYVPFVVETSAGLDRTILMLLCDAYDVENLNGETRNVLRLDPGLAPIGCAVFPLVKKAPMPEIARRVIEDLSDEFRCVYDEKGAIGRRYRRMDEIGTPYCVTIDGQSTEDQTATIRNRDTMEQQRVALGLLRKFIRDSMSRRRP